jgi:predicted transcriptional regulator
MDKDMKTAINYSHTLSRAEKSILTILSDFECPLSSSHIQDLMSNSKQALHYSLKRLQEKELVTRQKTTVFLYAINKEKIKPIVDLYKKSQKYKKI